MAEERALVADPPPPDPETRREASAQVRHRRKVRQQKVNAHRLSPVPLASRCYDDPIHHVILMTFRLWDRCTAPFLLCRRDKAVLCNVIAPFSELGWKRR
jgi:hypothetical protein